MIKNKPIKDAVILCSLFIFGVLILFLRNMDAVRFPVLYAEDGTWTGRGLTYGWVQLFISARSDYFVFINVALLFLSTKISSLLSGSPLNLLPQTISFVSFAFVSIVNTGIYFVVNKSLPFLFSITIYLILLLLPLGETQSVILGRILQLGFYIPLIYIFLLFWRTDLKQSAAIFFIDVALFLCVATNPVVFAFLFSYLLWELYRVRNIITLLKRNFVLIFTHTVLFSIIFPRLIGSNGGISNEYVGSNLIEAIIARPILYPFVFPWYTHLSDLISILLFCFWIFVIIYSYKLSQNLKVKRMILFLIVALFICDLATIMMRPGLTAWLDRYQKTFPDYYFMGLNMLTISLTLVSLSQLGISKKFINQITGYSILLSIIFIYLFNYSYVFLSINSLNSYLLFSDQLCLGKKIENSSVTSVKIYPQNSDWNMIVPTKFISKERCNYESFYDAGISERVDFYRMKPSEKLLLNMPIQIKMTPRHKTEKIGLKRIGILIACHGQKNAGLAELRLINTLTNTRFVKQFELSELIDNKYIYFDLDSNVYDSGEVVPVTGGGISSWVSYNDSEEYTCLIYEYTNGKIRFTPGCNVF